MSKTAALRKLIKEQMQTIQGETYHKSAPPGAVFPYKTFSLKNVSYTEERDDFDLCVDVWGRGSVVAAEEVADQVERLFNGANLPRPPIYPTFFRQNRYGVDDPDKTLQHIQLHFLVQLQEQEE